MSVRLLSAGLLLLMAGLGAAGLQTVRPPALQHPDTRWLAGSPIASIGPLKGLLVAEWWMRIHELQPKYEFGEIHALSGAICYLQPNIPEVWDYHAWNMAFNLVAEMDHDRQTQEVWLARGMAHLDRGLEHCPGSRLLLFQQGWLVYCKTKGDRPFTEFLQRRLGEPPLEYVYRKAMQYGLSDKGDLSHEIFLPQIAFETGRVAEARLFIGKLRDKYRSEAESMLKDLEKRIDGRK